MEVLVKSISVSLFLLFLLLSSASFANGYVDIGIRNGLSVNGSWTLESKYCRPKSTASIADRFKRQVLRQNSMAYKGELLVLSPNGQLRKFDDSANLVAASRWAMKSANEIQIVSTSNRSHLPTEMVVKVLRTNSMILSYNDENKCDGEIELSYSKVDLFSSRKYLID